jgi:soluble lytic murein transglycosylase-like protein
MRAITLFILLAIASASHADEMCFDAAAKRYRVPASLLVAISKVESNHNPKAININNNGSRDIGHMQINSGWLPVLAKYGITERILKDPCINTNIGAWILSQNIARHGLNWKAVGAYNAATEYKQVIYANKVVSALNAARLLQ